MSLVRFRCRFVVLLLAACGSSDAEPPEDRCSTPFEACGGDLLGSWQVYALCANESAIEGIFEGSLPLECAGAFRSAKTFPADLRLTFTNMGEAIINGAQQLHLEYSLDAACATA